MNIRVSVVIPTLDRPRPLAACLAALAVDFPVDAETIIVSDGGAEDLRPIVAPFVDRLRLRLLSIEQCGGPAAARNCGLESARGDIVAFTDDDCRPRPGWLAAIAEGVSISPPGAVGGTTRNGLPANPYADASQLVLDLLSRYDRAKTRRERFLASNNIAFPAAPLRNIGGFDEGFRTAEDRELCRRWIAAGFAAGRVPGAIIDHDAQLDLARFVRKFISYGEGAGQFHASGQNPSLRESAGFHFALPRILLPELCKRGAVRSAAIVALLITWEAANVVGFLNQRLGVRHVAAEAARTPVSGG